MQVDGHRQNVAQTESLHQIHEIIAGKLPYACSIEHNQEDTQSETKKSSDGDAELIQLYYLYLLESC